MLRTRLAVLAATLAAGAAFLPAGATARVQQGAAAGVQEGTTEVTGPLVVAAGDISCTPGQATTETTCRDADTAELVQSYDPKLVLGLGDLQYEYGTLAAFRQAYAETWGAFKSITRPVPGNHEYYTAGAAGYYDYFDRTRPGYYAFDVGRWRVYALNSNCAHVSCDREARWLDRKMTERPRRCTAITMHHPRYSSGTHGSTTTVRRLWRVALEHGTDLALAGHDHHYERFRRMNAAGGFSRTGIMSFVSGAGGRSHYSIKDVRRGSVVRDDDSFGALALTLGQGRFAWEYQTVDGTVVDSGTARCR